MRLRPPVDYRDTAALSFIGHRRKAHPVLVDRAQFRLAPAFIVVVLPNVVDVD